MKKIFPYLMVSLVAVVLMMASGCGQQTTAVSSETAISQAVLSDTSLYSFSVSDSTNTTASLTTSATWETITPFWWRQFVVPANIGNLVSITIASYDTTSASVLVTAPINGTLFLTSNLITINRKVFGHEYKAYVKLASTDGGTTWGVTEISPGISTSVASSDATYPGSMVTDLTLSQVTVTDTTSGTTLHDKTADPSSSGPWIDVTTLPDASKGDSLRVVVKAGRSGDSKSPFVYVWPGLTGTGAVLRYALFDDGTHGDTTAGDGIYNNTTQSVPVPTDEPVGKKTIHVGAFSAGTLANATDLYNHKCWHLLYEVK